MALSLDDRLLGEKVHNYCSSSEDEGERDDEDDYGDFDSKASTRAAQAPSLPEPEIQPFNGKSTNTGPKGVMNDWRRYKQLETEKKEEQEREKLALMKKLSISSRSHLDDEKESEKDRKFMEQFEQELEEVGDEFMKEYRQRRIEDMRKALSNRPTFGKVISLSSEEFVLAIDKENPLVTIIVHVYENGVRGCEAMNGCLKCLAQEYPTVKFCNIRASHTKLSVKFSHEGVPALLIYKKGELIGNFIRMSDDLGEDFFADDVESFLLEHGMLPDKSVVNAGLRVSAAAEQDSDSDLDLD